MRPFGKPRIKICCIASREEAWMAINAGASALGLVSRMPSGPGVIPEDRIAKIVAGVPPAVSTFLLTSEQDVAAIIAQQRRTRVNTLQICDRLSPEGHRALRTALPGVALIQVVHVQGPETLEEAESIETTVDAVLLDSGNPDARHKELGGTGRVHNWEVSRRVRKQLSIPVFLAGGLTSDNVSQAVNTVAPFGVDVCTGVRTEGKLDALKLRRFVSAVTEARVAPGD